MLSDSCPDKTNRPAKTLSRRGWSSMARDRFFFSYRLVVLSAALCLLAACAGPSLQPEPQEKFLTGAETLKTEEMEEANDMACAYFYFLWGKTAENNRRFEEAHEAYEKALVCDEESEYIRQKLALLLIKMDRKEQAAWALEKIVSRNPLDTESRMLLAKVYQSLGRFDETVATYQEILAIQEDHDTLLMLGTLYVQNKDYEKAQEMLNRLVDLEGDSYQAHYALARLYRELRYIDRAAAAYEKALDLNWFMGLAFELAEFYEAQQENEKAVTVYRRIIEEGEAADMAMTSLVNLYLKLGQHENALEVLREMRQTLAEPNRVDLTISRILLTQGKYGDAILVLSDILEATPELTVARYLLGMAYFHHNETEKAAEELDRIPAESSFFEDSILLRAKMLTEEKRYSEAIALLLEQVNDPATRKPAFFVLLATLYREHEDSASGREIYQDALQFYPEDTDILYNFGIFLERSGEHDEALAMMQQVLALEPDNGAALNYVGYTWADNNINLEKALDYIKKAVALLPDDGYVRDSLGWAYFKMGEVEQAAIELEKAAAMVGDDPVIQEHLGDVYTAMGQVEKARSAYEKSWDLFTKEEERERLQGKIDALPGRGQ
ncbi:MAG: tetratricopeptide repeat protein [Deltaproteobacteria bacterium]|nr:tetratricopeptide repeat protein [Deltaproteobacteria bacterium]